MQRREYKTKLPQSGLPSCMCLEDYGSADKAVTRLDHLGWILGMYMVEEPTKMLQVVPCPPYEQQGIHTYTCTL